MPRLHSTKLGRLTRPDPARSLVQAPHRDCRVPVDVPGNADDPGAAAAFTVPHPITRQIGFEAELDLLTSVRTEEQVFTGRSQLRVVPRVADGARAEAELVERNPAPRFRAKARRLRMHSTSTTDSAF